MIENLFTGLQYIVPTLVLLGFCVFVHELGHLLGGRLVGIKARTFSIGFGFPLIKKKVGETTYQIAAFPLGGFCSFYGEDANDEREGKTYEFLTASPWRRLVAVIAGPLFNLIFGIILFFVMNMTGYRTETTQIIIPSYLKKAATPVPAVRAGLLDGDIIRSMDGREVFSFTDIQGTIALGNGAPIVLGVERGGNTLTIPVTPEKGAFQSHYTIGIMPWGERVLIAGIVKGEAADEAGLKAMDEVVTADGIPMKSEEALVDYIKSKPGTPIAFDIVRGGKKMVIKAAPRVRETFEIADIASPVWKVKNVTITKIDTLKRAAADGKLKFNDMPVSSVEAFNNAAIILGGKPTKIEIPEGVFTATFRLKKEGFLGIEPARSPDMVLVKFPFSRSLAKAFTDPADFISKNIRSLGMLFTGKLNVRENLSGPLMIGRIAGDTAKHRGIGPFIVLMAKISIILMIMNLLPIPAVDGSYVLFFLWEGITRRPISEKVMGYIQYAGFIFIILLSVLVVFNDIAKLFFGV